MLMSRFVNRFNIALKKYPIATNMAVYSTFYTAAELSQQTFHIMTQTEKSHYDFVAAAKIAAVGSCIYAPTLYFWYRYLDKKFPGTTFKAITSKVFCDQMFMSPALIAGFYTAFGLIDGRDDMFAELRQKFWKTYMMNQIYWIPGQTINFSFVPPQLRVCYVASASFIWINIICIIKREQTHQNLHEQNKQIKTLDCKEEQQDQIFGDKPEKGEQAR